jgi:Transposase DDE domain
VLGLLGYGDATGVCRTRQSAQATDASWPFRFIAGDMPPDHDTLAHVRQTVLSDIPTLFAPLLLSASEAGGLQWGAMSLEGTQRPAEAAQRKAVRANRLSASAAHRRTAVEDVLALGGRAAQGEPVPEGRVISEASVRRPERRTSLAEAKAVSEARAEARDRAAHLAEEAKRRERAEKVRTTGRTPRGRPPSPPPPGARDNAQDHCTDPASPSLKNRPNQGFDQHDKAPIATAQDRLWSVGHALAHPAKAQAEVAPTCAAIPPAVGTPPAAALDNGSCSEAHIERCAARGLEPSMATGRDAPAQSGRERFVQTSVPPLDDASPKVNMAAKRHTEIGKAIDRFRTCTVEPVLGISKATLGFRQFSLRGLKAAAGEWGLGCLAFNLKRLHTLTNGQSCSLMISPTGC